MPAPALLERVPEPPPPAADEPSSDAEGRSVLGLAELLLKQPARADRLTRDEARQADLIPRFLALALGSFTAFAATLVLLLNAVPAEALPPFLALDWAAGRFGPPVALALAYTLGLVAATGVCLPSFYFYTLLAGVKTSLLHVTAQVVKSKAFTAVVLVGVLPIYVAVVLGMLVFGARPTELQLALYLGLVLPFLAGLAGVWSLYHGLMGLADTLPPQRRCRRECFLRRLTLAMAGCYSAVTPVMIYTLWKSFVTRF
jgi:hypothetical protein